MLCMVLGMPLAPFKKPRSQNIPGNLYVDESCIDCDVCRWMCPTVFERKGIKSAVTKQPTSEAEKLSAYASMIACPVGSIRTRSTDSLVKQALDVFPAEVRFYLFPYRTSLLIASLFRSTQ